jgi:outer membrane protein TolC
VNAQSLIFSFQQRQYIRAARTEIVAAKAALEEAREEAQEDAAITYVSLDEAQAAIQVLTQQYEFANDLIRVDEDRNRAGVESDLEVIKARRGAIQIKLQELQTEDALQAAKEHLAELTGLPMTSLMTDSKSIPTLPTVDLITGRDLPSLSQTPGMRAAEENAKAKEQRAHGDAEYTWRPLVTFGAQYGRVSPINNVSEFYNLHGNYNTANIGFQVEFPIVDRVRSAAAREALIDASRARLDLDSIRLEQTVNLQKLQRSLPELAAKAELAEMDFEIAQNELTSTTIQLQRATGRPPLTPKEEATAHIQERQRYLELIDTKLQSAKAEITFLRQTGQLPKWLDGAVAAAGGDSQPDGPSIAH